MIKRLLLCSTGALAAVLFLAAPAHAQTNASPLVPRADVFAGVAFWDEEERNLAGFHLAGTWRPGKHVGIVGDMVVYDDRTTFMGGVRVQSTGRHTIFGQILIGNAPLDDIAIQPGIGLDVRVSSRTAVRAGFDVKISGDEGGTFIGTRLSVGLVFLLGRQ